MNFLPGGKLVAEVPTDSVAIGSTEDNLKISIDEERYEGVKAYQAYAEVADKEGFPVIASHFRAIAQIEQHHLDRFRPILTSSRREPSGKEKNRFTGSVWFAVTSTKGQNLLLSALPATIRTSITSAWTFISNEQKV